MAVELNTRGLSISTAVQALTAEQRDTMLLGILSTLVGNGELVAISFDGSTIEGVEIVPDALATAAELIAGTDEENIVVSANLADCTTPETGATTQSGATLTVDFTDSLWQKFTITANITTITMTQAPPVHGIGTLEVVGDASNQYTILTPNNSTNWSPPDLSTADTIPVAANTRQFISIINDGTNIHWIPCGTTRANA